MKTEAQKKASKKWIEQNKEHQYALNKKTASKSYYYKIANDIRIQFKMLRKMDIFD